jgi:hypothetical protein
MSVIDVNCEGACASDQQLHLNKNKKLNEFPKAIGYD